MESLKVKTKKRKSQRVSNSLWSKLNEFICRYQFGIIKNKSTQVKSTETSRRKNGEKNKYNCRAQHKCNMVHWIWMQCVHSAHAMQFPNESQLNRCALRTVDG